MTKSLSNGKWENNGDNLVGGKNLTGTGTKFGGYLSSSPTCLKYQMDIYWPIMKTKVTNNEYSLHSM